MKISTELLSELAPYHPINHDEMGGCVWCGGTPPRSAYGYAGRYLSDHDKLTCPWLKARKILGDAIPKSRTSERKAKK